MYRPGTFFCTASTTSTVGPHVRDEQYFGVAKVTRIGTCAFSESATEYCRSERSGGSAVVSFARSPCSLAIVGVREAIAASPTSGTDECFATSIVATPRIDVPAGVAWRVYRPGLPMSNFAT